MLKQLTVSEFNNIIKNIFVAEEMLHNVAVIGEVSGFNPRGAHAYFSVKDACGVLSCCCFNYKKTYVPKDGESVVLTGSPDYYVQGGRFSFVVGKIEPLGLGLLYQRIEELKKKLESEGVFDVAHKKPIPKFSKEICVVTSKTGAVIRDIYRTVRKKNPAINIVVKDVKVQGEFAVKEIVSALNAVDKLNFDCVILARGGGSIEDLMPFYDEGVVRAVYNMKTPIISAIGHETDFSLCDFAADVRAPTPTAAGELVAYDFYQIKDSIFELLSRAERASHINLDNCVHKTKYLAASVSGGMEKLLKDNLSRLKLAAARISAAVSMNLQDKQHNVNRQLTALDNLNPARILNSGYFRVYGDGQAVTSVKNVNVGDRIIVRGADGKIFAGVTDVEVFK